MVVVKIIYNICGLYVKSFEQWRPSSSPALGKNHATGLGSPSRASWHLLAARKRPRLFDSPSPPQKASPLLNIAMGNQLLRGESACKYTMPNLWHWQTGRTKGSTPCSNTTVVAGLQMLARSFQVGTGPWANLPLSMWAEWVVFLCRLTIREPAEEE